MSYTHFRGVSTWLDGYAVGKKGSEVQIVDISGNLYQAGTVIGATAAELNTLDVSAQTTTTIGAGALSVTTLIDNLALVGAGAVTLAAPSASVLGKTKVISMTVDNGDVTLSLANCSGGSAATTCTWSAVGQSLVLVAGTTKWIVVGEGGVALT